jgi:hypothetical protein
MVCRKSWGLRQGTISLIAFLTFASILLCVHSKRENGEKKCTYLPDSLIGRCWGLTGIEEKHFDWTGVKKREVASAEECEELCCEMGDACITYQFRGREKKCLIGKHVRLGKEGGNTPLWCEPLPPAKWNGRKRLTNTAESIATPEDQQRQRTHKCEWGEHLPRQCWHLGPERVNATGGRMGPKACAMGCCRTKNCIAWQQLPDRGCFYNDQPMDELHCDQNEETYEGKRKKYAV